MAQDSFSPVQFPATTTRAWAFTIFAAALVYVSAVKFREAIPYAAVCVVLALASWARVRPGFTLTFDDEGVTHSGLRQRVAYREIHSMCLSQFGLMNRHNVERARYFLLGHAHGEWRLPKSGTCDRLSLYEFLLPRTRLLEAPESLPGGLNQVAATEEAQFPGKVFATRGRTVLPSETPNPLAPLAVSLAAIVGIVANHSVEPVADSFGTFDGMAGVAIFLGVLFAFAFAKTKSALRKVRAATGLVMSPRGLTLEHPTTRGALAWGEITKLVTFSGNRPGIAAARGVLVLVDGGRILLEDGFACPMTEILRRMEENWAFEQG